MPTGLAAPKAPRPLVEIARLYDRGQIDAIIKNSSQPGFLGSVFIQATTAAYTHSYLDRVLIEKEKNH